MANSLFESAREAERRAIAITDMVHGGSWMVRPRRPRQQRKRKQSPCWQAWTARRRQRAPHSPDMATGPAAPPCIFAVARVEPICDLDVLGSVVGMVFIA